MLSWLLFSSKLAESIYDPLALFSCSFCVLSPANFWKKCAKPRAKGKPTPNPNAVPLPAHHSKILIFSPTSGSIKIVIVASWSTQKSDFFHTKIPPRSAKTIFAFSPLFPLQISSWIHLRLYTNDCIYPPWCNVLSAAGLAPIFIKKCARGRGGPGKSIFGIMGPLLFWNFQVLLLNPQNCSHQIEKKNALNCG